LIEDERENSLNKYTSVGSLGKISDIHVITFETNVHPIKKEFKYDSKPILYDRARKNCIIIKKKFFVAEALEIAGLYAQ
jgi:hypothetical protein